VLAERRICFGEGLLVVVAFLEKNKEATKTSRLGEDTRIAIRRAGLL